MFFGFGQKSVEIRDLCKACLLYTSDAADERSSVDLGGRRIIKKKNKDDVEGGCDVTNIHGNDREHIEAGAKTTKKRGREARSR